MTWFVLGLTLGFATGVGTVILIIAAWVYGQHRRLPLPRRRASRRASEARPQDEGELPPGWPFKG